MGLQAAGAAGVDGAEGRLGRPELPGGGIGGGSIAIRVLEVAAVAAATMNQSARRSGRTKEALRSSLAGKKDDHLT